MSKYIRNRLQWYKILTRGHKKELGWVWEKYHFNSGKQFNKKKKELGNQEEKNRR